MKSFEYWKQHFEQNDLLEFSCTEEGLLWLKLRSIDRKDLVVEFCKRLGITVETKVSETIWKKLNDDVWAQEQLSAFMRECQAKENQRIKMTFDSIRSNLYKMNHFHWGGGFRNSLDKTIVSRYVKTQEIIPYEQLDRICETELLEMSRGYLHNSWYNYWSSILLENIFRRNDDIMPAYGKIKNVDFFVKDFPFDLKVTYLPKEYATIIRKELKIPEPLKKLKQYARSSKIVYDKTADDETMQYELNERIRDAAQHEGLSLLSEIKQDWLKTVDHIMMHKRDLIKWLYENQGDMRFGSENRIFLILVDKENPSDAWKLKRNIDLISPAIEKWIDNFDTSNVNTLMLCFNYKSKQYQTFSDALFIYK